MNSTSFLLKLYRGAYLFFIVRKGKTELEEQKQGFMKKSYKTFRCRDMD